MSTVCLFPKQHTAYVVVIYDRAQKWIMAFSVCLCQGKTVLYTKADYSDVEMETEQSQRSTACEEVFWNRILPKWVVMYQYAEHNLSICLDDQSKTKSVQFEEPQLSYQPWNNISSLTHHAGNRMTM